MDSMRRQQAYQLLMAKKWIEERDVSAFDYDPSVINLLKIRVHLGWKGLQCVLQGLSRPITPCSENVRQLIEDWEYRRKECCFQGNAEELLMKKNVLVIAISYRHERMDRWYRRGQQQGKRVSKMSDMDQRLLEEAMDQIKRFNEMAPDPTKAHYSNVILWCDQILSTHLDGEENHIGWYNAGLIPFAFLPVMALSTPPYSEEDLDKRVWIKAERSLGRKGKGVFSPNQTMQFLEQLHPLERLLSAVSSLLTADPTERRLLCEQLDPDILCPSNWLDLLTRRTLSGRELLQSVAYMILSGYWPEPERDDYWYNDYHDMKKWAMYICCKPDYFGGSRIAFFDSIIPVDFTEVLSRMYEISSVTNISTDFERGYTVHDNHFYLKATAWNPWISQTWPADDTKISHYMGRLGSRFSWWTSCVTGNIFGFMALNLDPTGGNQSPPEYMNMEGEEYDIFRNATIIVAIKIDSGFTLFRSKADSRVYEHAERVPSHGMKTAFASVARANDLDIDFEEEWSLLFAWDSREPIEPNEPSYPNEILQWTREEGIKADAYVPYALMGTTVRLYLAAEARAGLDASASVIETFISAVKIWNRHIKESFETCVCVRDAEDGPVWLEGYTKQYVTFGFLDFLTRVLFTVPGLTDPDAVPMYHHEVLMPNHQDVIDYVLRASTNCKADVRLMVEEVLGEGTRESGGITLDDHEVATFMVSGGFTSTSTGFAVEPFVVMVAKRRGYWQTLVRCRNGKMQILFTSNQNDVRIAQRSTTLVGYAGLGLVRPGMHNVQNVLDISEELTLEEYNDGRVWKDMTDTFCRGDAISRFGDARLRWDGDEVWLLDTTRCEDVEKGIISYFEV